MLNILTKNKQLVQEIEELETELKISQKICEIQRVWMSAYKEEIHRLRREGLISQDAYDLYFQRVRESYNIR